LTALTLLLLMFSSDFSGDAELTDIARQARAHVRFLAADSLEGRETAYRGQKTAAQYIAAHFERIGLQPALADSDQPWFHRYQLVVRDFVPGSLSMELKGHGPKLSLEPQRDAFVRPRGDGAVSVKAGLIFAGYGIKIDGYDDFAGIDIKDRWAVVLEGQPPAREGGALFDKPVRESFSFLKYRKAKDAGAAGIVILQRGAPSTPPEVDHSGSPMSMRLPDGEWRRSSDGFPYIILPEPAWANFLGDYRQRVETAVAAIDETHQPQSFAMTRRQFAYSAVVRDMPKIAENVIAVLPGADPALSREYVALTAHYDHVGVIDGQVHNGADDNASGVSGVLLLAERLHRKPSRRSIMFILFSGEEKGLLGSKRYVANPVVPLDQMAAVVNMDMIGRNDPGQIGVIPSKVKGVTTLNQTLARINQNHRFELLDTMDRYHRRSDHYSFTESGVPAIFLFSDVHEHYHHADDDWQRLDYGKIARVIRLVEDFVVDIANADTRPTFLEVEEEKSSESE